MIKENFDKCNKDKLLEFSDVLDIQVGNANSRKVCWFNPTDTFVVAACQCRHGH
jgi:hypothetical protein